MEVYFRHGRVREGQRELIADAAECLARGRHLVCHAPTGLGKTDAVLSPALSYAMEKGLTVFFLTPKIAQHEVAISVLRGLHEKYGLGFRAMDLIGKRYMCADASLRAVEADEFYELCKRKRKNESCSYYKACRGYGQKTKVPDDLVKWYGAVRSHKELADYCAERGICPYEAAVMLAREAHVIVGDYYHVLSPSVSETFLAKTGKSLKDSIIILDEGQNVPDRVRKALTVSLDTALLGRAQKECRLLRKPELSRILGRIERQLGKLGSAMKEDEELATAADLPALDSELIEEIHEAGADYLEATNRARSACIKVARFFGQWSLDSPAYMRLLRRWRTGTGYTLSHRCLDPSVYTADVLNSARSVIVMSGTLKPQEMYRDLLGLDGSRTELREYRSPFPRHNRLCLLVTGITTKYASRTEAEYARIAGKASEVLNAIPGNSAVFFPSFAVQRRILPLLNLARPVLAQKEKSSPAENTGMLAQFRQHAKRGGAVLAGVAGGSFSEGIDLPGEELLGVVVVGIPLGEPDLETQALIDYYDCKYGRGWAYGYIYPAMSRAVQAGGRCIRNETDRGVVAFLDSRFAWENYSRCFPRDLDFTVTESPGEHVRRFWSILPSEEDKIH